MGPVDWCRMGLQSGTVVGGVIGVKHPRYRLFGRGLHSSTFPLHVSTFCGIR